MASIETKPIRLKDGRVATIRTPLEADAEAVLELGRANITDGTGSVMLPEEFKFTIEEEQKWLRDHFEHPAKLVLTAEAEGKPVGMLNFQVNERKRLCHGGTLGIALLPGWRGLGIGEAMMRTLLDWARANPLVTRVQLNVLADNAPAIALYRKLGFVEEGRRRNFVRRGENDYVDDLVMGILV